jgi:hypothetical protein
MTAGTEATPRIVGDSASQHEVLAGQPGWFGAVPYKVVSDSRLSLLVAHICNLLDGIIRNYCVA